MGKMIINLGNTINNFFYLISFRHTNNMDVLANAASRKMIAKYDYDSTALSPNVDAEQVID